MGTPNMGAEKPAPLSLWATAEPCDLKPLQPLPKEPWARLTHPPPELNMAILFKEDKLCQ